MSLRLAGVVAPGGRDGKRGGLGSVVLGFGYTPKMQRASMSNSSAGVVQGSTYYLGFDALTHGELRIAGAAPKTAPPAWVDYLHVGGRLVGAFSTMCGASPCVKPGSGFNIAAMSHAAFGAGQLASVTALTGSVAAASATPNGWGSLLAAIGNGPAGQYYDPWCARRIAVPAPPPGSIASSEHRGFICEEHLDSFGLINLNRRLYDPHIGRFLAADPIAQGFFADPQRLNRYSYADNMPLSASDSSGFDPEGYGPESYAKGDWEGHGDPQRQDPRCEWAQTPVGNSRGYVTPWAVRTMFDGWIMKTGYELPGYTRYGGVVVVRNSDGTITIYAHLDIDRSQYPEGADVKSGDIIGAYAIPTNGDSSGPHGHVEWRNPNDRSDPPSSALPNGFLGKVLDPGLDNISIVVADPFITRPIQYVQGNFTHPRSDVRSIFGYGR